jgi:hypothetical protein
MNGTSLGDVVVVLAVVGGAVAFLVWNLVGRKTPPPCAVSGMRVDPNAPPVVLVGGGLARGLARAQTRQADKSGPSCCE